MQLMLTLARLAALAREMLSGWVIRVALALHLLDHLLGQYR